MDPVTGAIVAGSVLQAGANVLSNRDAQRQIGAQDRFMRERLMDIMNIPDPDLRQYEIEQLKNEFNYSPEAVAVIDQAQSELAGYQASPELQTAQMAALQKLGTLTEGKLTDTDVGMLRQAEEEAAMAERGQQEAILQSMARRGISGSGQELAARLSSQQTSANRQAADARNMQNVAQSRALQAIAQQGSLAGDIRGQQFGEAQNKAAAMDAINRFNAQNRQNVLGQNVAARNQANQMAAANRQDISNTNVNIRNMQRDQANQIAQQQFQNRLARSSAAAGGAASAQENALAGIKQDTAAQGRMIDSIGGALESGLTWYNQDDKKTK